jgi:RND family efflux transporter MFP subunit
MANAAHVAPARRSWRARLVPPLVVVGMTALVLWSAWPTLRPVEEITVTQALYDPSQPTTLVDASARQTEQSDEDAPRPGAVTVQAPGWLEADPFYTACTALADGVVEEMLVLEGDTVEAGDVVARLVDEDARLKLAEAEARLDAARAEAALLQAELEAAETEWNEPVERERAVAVGRAALAEAEAELRQLDALIAAAAAEAERLEEELARTRTAFESNAATEIEVVVLDKQAQAQRARLASVEARRPMLEARVERLAAEHEAAERHAELRTSERRALAAARAAVQRAEAAVAAAQVKRDEAALLLERMTIRAPISGVVQRRLKQNGDKVMRGMDSPHSAHLVHLYHPERIQVRVDVPLADAANVYLGQPCEVVVEVLPDRTFAGEVTRITHEADLQKNTLQVKVRVLDPEPLLRPEMLTRVKFLPHERDGARSDSAAAAAAGVAARVLVEPGALDATASATQVWVVRQRRGDRGVVQPVVVQVQGEEQTHVAVRGELRPGDLLALAPNGLRPGQAVRLIGAADELAQAEERPAPADRFSSTTPGGDS